MLRSKYSRLAEKLTLEPITYLDIDHIVRMVSVGSVLTLILDFLSKSTV